MAQKQLIVSVRKDGTVHAETVGMYGDECLDYFAVLEDLLDAEVASSTYTADYSATGQAQTDANVQKLGDA
jgi:Protein of unknown function (DUF2997).